MCLEQKNIKFGSPAESSSTNLVSSKFRSNKTISRAYRTEAGKFVPQASTPATAKENYFAKPTMGVE